MSRSHRVFEWFREIGEEIQADWERLHQQAESDPQRAGHGGEATWADHLGRWLPPRYDVATRKYILFEVEGAPEPRETDVVIYSPGYPRKLRGREGRCRGRLQRSPDAQCRRYPRWCRASCRDAPLLEAPL